VALIPFVCSNRQYAKDLDLRKCSPSKDSQNGNLVKWKSSLTSYTSLVAYRMQSLFRSDVWLKLIDTISL
jgi:hypothetical protein